MSAPLIEVKQVSKIYPLLHTPKQRLAALWRVLVGKPIGSGQQVLDQVNLRVEKGQSLAVIGENGAGKSTLLKILTGVLKPTFGQVEVNAKVAALLELGAGFQPNFTGMENLRMKATLLGLTDTQIDQRLDDILAFADIGESIHEPVKHYSSGMVVRLGFAVMTACEPDLIITDEVLAVGDESFQKKCVSWIESFLAGGGTLLLVSHSMFQVQRLCRQALWLKDGAVQMAGDVFRVTQAYLAYHEQRTAQQKSKPGLSTGDSGYYQVLELLFTGQDADSAPQYASGDDLTASIIIHSPDGRAPTALIGVVRADGTPIYGVSSDLEQITPEALDANRFAYRISFTDLALLPGSYTLRAHAMDPEGVRLCDTLERRFIISGESREMGYIRLPHRWD